MAWNHSFQMAWLGYRAVAAALALIHAGCGAASEKRASAGDRVEQRLGLRVWSYRVEAGPQARELRVQAELPQGVPAILGVDHFAHPYLYDLEVSFGGRWQPVARQGRRWHAPQCQQLGCRLRYRYDLGQAAEQIDRFGFAAFRGGALLAPPSTWLLHPQDYAGDDLYRFSVSVAPGESFTSGVRSLPGEDAVYQAPAALLFQAPYSGFGQFRHERLELDAGVIRLSVSLAGRELALSPSALRLALGRTARVVSDYFGRFPVPEVAVIVLPIAGSEVFGMQLGNGGATVLLFMGRQLTAAALERDWVMLHELFHLGFPTLTRRHLWLAEGLATYQEPIARARAGLIDSEQLWREFLLGMPKGQPGEGDPGLDGTTSWGRTYWGGALFCLLADLEIREKSNNRLSLDDAARGILNAGGDTSVRWTLEQTLAAADRALGRPVLGELYAEHAHSAVSVDLEAVWRRLGVRPAAAGVVFDDDAEWAHIRRAISEPVPVATAPPRAQGAQLGFALPGVPKSPL